MTHDLYRYDNLQNPLLQEGKTLRNKPIGGVISAVAGGDQKRFKHYFADPTASAEGNPLHRYYADHKTTAIGRTMMEIVGSGEWEIPGIPRENEVLLQLSFY